MQLNLREIINIPGGKVPFQFELDLSEMTFNSVEMFKAPVCVSGQVANAGGVLTLTAAVDAQLVCVCARCLIQFENSVHFDVDVTLAESTQDEDDPDVYLLEGDSIDVDEVIVTAFVLNMEQRFLCREDCQGLCEKCGADLNEGHCNCKANIDPRLAVLGQLLEND